MSEHPTTAPSTRESHPVVGAPRWGVSAQDWQSHALDEGAEHPDGVYVARCGQRLAAGTTLYDEPPGWMCVSCLRHTQRGDTAT
ncbi:MAG: hypothetical protein ACRDRS_15515 [Pseudonocardiaceae bacterium]